MPNGQLSSVYKEDVLKAGKNPGKTRFNFSKVPNFKLLDNKKRIKVVYINNDKIRNDIGLTNKLQFLLDIYDKQG